MPTTCRPRRLARRLPCPTALFVAIALLGASAVAQTTLRPPAVPHGVGPDPRAGAAAVDMVAIRRIAASLDSGDLDEARRQLDGWLDSAAEGPARYVGALLKSQIDGRYRRQHAFFLNRQAGDTVVLVPDEPSFIAAVRQWTDERFFPVLIEDAWYSPLFVAAYKPRQVVRWSIDAADLPPIDQHVNQVLAAHNQNYEGDETPDAPGMVVIDPASSKRAGGLALAFGRGQPGIALTTDDKWSNTVDPLEVADYNDIILPHAVRWKLVRHDQWFGITLAGNYPFRYQEADRNQRLAVDDLLGRNGQGLRLGVVGRLSGDAVESVYQAMCSLFLDPHRALFFDDYSNRGGAFNQYRLNRPAGILNDFMRIQLVQNDRVNPGEFRKLTRQGDPYDFYWVNSSGGARDWALGSGKHKAYVDDLPIGWPCIWYMIHSNSAANPATHDTVAGRVIAGGGYWAFGSVHEPLLNAFAIPTGMAARISTGTPIAFAARALPGQAYYKPWKLMLVGDPLLSLREKPAERIDWMPLDGATPVSFAANDASAIGLTLRNACFDPATGFGRTPSPEQLRTIVGLLVAALQTPRELSPHELARVVFWFNALDKPDVTADLDVELAQKHPIAEALVWRAALGRFDDALRREGLDVATARIDPMVRLLGVRQVIQERLERWLAAMAKAERRAEAEAKLASLQAIGLPHASRSAIDQALKSLPAAPQTQKRP